MKTIIEKQIYGKIGNNDIYLFTISNNIIRTEIITYGGVIRSLEFFKNGKKTDIVLGFDSLEEYLDRKRYFGAVIGRYANRIADGKFSISGKEYFLSRNDGVNTLHGGFEGFDKKIWQASVVEDGIVLSYTSPNGEEGFPGNLLVRVKYLLKDNSFSIEYYAVSDQDTIVSLTSHPYFNLNGEGNGNIEGHELYIDADYFTLSNSYLIPTGEVKPVNNTPFDFRVSKRVGQDINDNDAQLKIPNGYDHNFIVNGAGFRKAAEVKGDKTGIVMEIFTDMPGLQFLSNNGDDKIIGKGGKIYGKRSSLCLEPEFFPNSPNVKTFPSPVLSKGEAYYSKTQFILK